MNGHGISVFWWAQTQIIPETGLNVHLEYFFKTPFPKIPVYVWTRSYIGCLESLKCLRVPFITRMALSIAHTFIRAQQSLWN